MTRKPRPFRIDGWYYAEILDNEYVYFHAEAFRHDYMALRDVKRLAAWLLKAAEWIREKEGKR